MSFVGDSVKCIVEYFGGIWKALALCLSFETCKKFKFNMPLPNKGINKHKI